MNKNIKEWAKLVKSRKSDAGSMQHDTILPVYDALLRLSL
jgi:hypothetical protein